LGDGAEEEVRAHLSYLWEVQSENWTLLKFIDIPYSLPNHPPGKELVVEDVLLDGIYLAGDWMATPSQQGALLSGRRAANAIIADR
jgi:predicted NAD/FAD-dependent oxidoreductase